MLESEILDTPQSSGSSSFVKCTSNVYFVHLNHHSVRKPKLKLSRAGPRRDRPLYGHLALIERLIFSSYSEVHLPLRHFLGLWFVVVSFANQSRPMAWEPIVHFFGLECLAPHV